MANRIGPSSRSSAPPRDMSPFAADSRMHIRDLLFSLCISFHLVLGFNGHEALPGRSSISYSRCSEPVVISLPARFVENKILSERSGAQAQDMAVSEANTIEKIFLRPFRNKRMLTEHLCRLKLQVR